MGFEISADLSDGMIWDLIKEDELRFEIAGKNRLYADVERVLQLKY
jgi:hypothetical protein